MLATISKALGLSTAPDQHQLMPRQINLSGNIVHFAMPENFSKDMPAENMIESVDLSDKSVYGDYQKFTLIRRWWDFKDSGWFGKEYGTLMMSLYIKEAAETVSVDTLKPLNFIDIIIDDIERSKPENPDPLRVYSDYFAAYREQYFNQQRWIEYAQDKTDPPQILFLYAIPVTEKQYLVAEFTTAPDDSVGIRNFLENHTLPFTNKIMNTFQIDYLPDNPAKQAVLKTDGPTLQQLIDKKIKQLEHSSQVD